MTATSSPTLCGFSKTSNQVKSVSSQNQDFNFIENSMREKSPFEKNHLTHNERQLVASSDSPRYSVLPQEAQGWPKDKQDLRASYHGETEIKWACHGHSENIINLSQLHQNPLIFYLVTSKKVRRCQAPFMALFLGFLGHTQRCSFVFLVLHSGTTPDSAWETGFWGLSLTGYMQGRCPTCWAIVLAPPIHGFYKIQKIYFLKIK